MPRSKWLKGLCILVMLACCCVTCWYVVTTDQLESRRTELTQKLETSMGRERKQQAEYDQVLQQLPEQDAALEQLLPQAEAAKAEADALKAQRKTLRAELAALSDALAQTDAPEEELARIQTLLTQAQSDLDDKQALLDRLLEQTHTVLMLLRSDFTPQ